MGAFSPRKILHLIGYWAVLLWIASCVGGQDKVEAPVIEYNGVGLHQSNPQNTVVSGVIKSKNFTGGEILVEARRSVPCAYGRCPVVGEEPLAQQKLSSPGPYSLQLGVSAKDLIIVATEPVSGGGARIAHQWVLSEAADVAGVDLSMDRPYPPLR
ncbi:MAG TPA: hypothetical protein VJR29_00275 [bacterium]|nr:hypothetical protein [bacterium]